MSFFTSGKKPSSKIHIPVEKYTLKNGFKVLLNPNNKAHTATYILGFAVGSRHETPGITGISHMFEHLMFKGTKKYPAFKETYHNQGIMSNAFTSKDYTAYHAVFSPEHLDLILDVESDRTSQLILNQKLLDTERMAVQEEKLLSLDHPTQLLLDKILDLLFIKHPYRWPVIGYEKDISSYTLDNLKNWYTTYYSPNNATLVVSGKVSVRKAKSLIEKYFGPLVKKNIPPEIQIKEPEQKKSRSRSVYKNVQAPKVIMGYVIPPPSRKEFYALEFISYILGYGESSYLHRKMVRENKLVSYISSFAWDFLDYGVFFIYYHLSNHSKEKEVKQLILEEVQRGMAREINTQSIEKVKNSQMNELIYSLKKSASRARLLLDHEMQFNDYKKIYEKLDILNDLSLEFVQQTGEKYLNPDRMSYVILKSDGKIKRQTNTSPHQKTKKL